jgi:hypothetical protein
VLATFVLSSEIGDAETIFNAVFFVVVVSALLQGTTLEWFAGRLGLVDPRPTVTAAPVEVDVLGSLELVEFDVAGDHAIAGAAVRELGLPRSALIAVVDRAIPPRGSTVVEPGWRRARSAPSSRTPSAAGGDACSSTSGRGLFAVASRSKGAPSPAPLLDSFRSSLSRLVTQPVISPTWTAASSPSPFTGMSRIDRQRSLRRGVVFPIAPFRGHSFVRNQA